MRILDRDRVPAGSRAFSFDGGSAGKSLRHLGDYERLCDWEGTRAGESHVPDEEPPASGRIGETACVGEGLAFRFGVLEEDPN